jgi:hypothetical protein
MLLYGLPDALTTLAPSVVDSVPVLTVCGLVRAVGSVEGGGGVGGASGLLLAPRPTDGRNGGEPGGNIDGCCSCGAGSSTAQAPMQSVRRGGTTCVVTVSADCRVSEGDNPRARRCSAAAC